jgi:hypothetical protein
MHMVAARTDAEPQESREPGDDVGAARDAARELLATARLMSRLPGAPHDEVAVRTVLHLNEQATIAEGLFQHQVNVEAIEARGFARGWAACLAAMRGQLRAV